MPLFRRCLLAFLLVLALPLHAATGDSDWFYRGSDLPRDASWQFGSLANGVRYALRRNPLPAGQVSIRVRIDAGSLNEADNERGWAHFVEHLAFRGTKNFEDREALHIWQQLGARFGSDTNASTSPTQTVYQLDLPHADRASLDQSLKILAEMMDVARFAPAAVDAERKIILAERRRRPELATRVSDVANPLFYAGLSLAERDPIGIDATLTAATADALRSFYERWYRPDRATIVVVGDADPAMLTELIASHFNGWQPSGPPPPEADDGRIAEPAQRVAALAYPGAPSSASVMWLRPHDERPDTIERTRDELAATLATQILNRRLEARARKEAAFISAGLATARQRRVADLTQLSLTARNGSWRKGLEESFAIIADATATPPSAGEIQREISNFRSSLASAVAGESTIRSPQWAQRLVNAIDDQTVVTNARDSLALFERLAPEMTTDRIAAATKTLFSGAGPRMLLLTPEAVEGDIAAVNAALSAAEKTGPAAREADRTVSFDALPSLGPPGKEVSRWRVDDMDVTIVRFANGSTLTFKQSEFEKGSVLVQFRFGNGLAGIPPKEPTPAWMSSVVAPSGLADLDLDAMERLLTGRKINMNFGVGEDAYTLTGATHADDLPDQLRLLAIKLAFPRWDAALLNRMKAGWAENFRMSFVSADARAGREFGAVTHPGDERWTPVEKETIVETDAEEFSAFFAPVLAIRPVDAIIVGDVDLDSAVAAAARTIGALPSGRAATPSGDVKPPRPNPEPQRFTHEGDPNQAHASIGWSTFGGTDRIKERRALSVAANILQTRLFERLREEEGVTYSPSASSTGSETLPSWGIFYISATIQPESVDTFLRIAREEVAKLAATPVGAEEFARAKNPIVSGIERRLKTNGFWLSALENWVARPDLIEQTRTYLSDYRDMTAEQVRAAVAAHVADEGDWSMIVLPEKVAADGK